MRFMILAPTLPWPLHGGRQINAHHLIHALVHANHDVLVVLRDTPNPSELAAWPLASCVAVVVMQKQTPQQIAHHDSTTPNSDSRWDRFFGNHPAYAEEVARLARDYQPDYVEGCGLETPLVDVAAPLRCHPSLAGCR